MKIVKSRKACSVLNMVLNSNASVAHVPQAGIELEVAGKKCKSRLAIGKGKRVPENTGRVCLAVVVKEPVEAGLDKKLLVALGSLLVTKPRTFSGFGRLDSGRLILLETRVPSEQ